MAISEYTFADRLARGKKMREAISSIPSYNPTDAKLSLSDFSAHLDAIENLNRDIASSAESLTTEINARLELVRGQKGLKKLATRVRSYCLSDEVFKPQLISIKQIVRKINNTRTKKAKLPTDVPTKDSEKKKRNVGEQSFGDLEKLGYDLLTTLKNIPGYSPSSSDITISGLDKLMNDFKNMNKSIAAKKSAHTTLLYQRRQLYEGKNGLRERMKRIRAYILAEYGKDSAEYAKVKDIKY